MTSGVEISKRLVLINTASGIVAKTINVSVLLWLHQYLLRRIRPEEYGLLQVLLSVILLLPVVTSILTAGLGRFVLAAYAQKDDRGVTQIVSTMFPLLLGAGLVILTGGLAFAWHVDTFLRVPPDRLWDARIMMALLVFSTGAKVPCMAFGVGFYVQQKFVLYNLIHVGMEILRMALLFVFLFGVSTRVVWVVVTNVVVELVLTTIVIVVSRRMIPALRFRLREIRWARAWELVSFGGWTFVSEITSRASSTAILFVLNRFAAADVAVYSLGYLGRRQINTWTDVIAAPLYPVATGMHALGAKDRVRHFYLRGGRLALWIMLITGLPGAIYAARVMPLYAGEDYAEAAPVMVLSLVNLITMGGSWMVWQLANALGRVRATGVRVLVSQPLIVALTWYVVYTLGWGTAGFGLGACGVALAACMIGLFFDVLLIWPLGLKLADVPFGVWVRQTLIPGLAPGCLASVVWVALDLLVAPDRWPALGV
ncbi:MAG: hypothetical protein MUC88_19280 [Planctomycetes bacterium]|nr:hypothetical protein [Planctomycetota bacterium]